MKADKSKWKEFMERMKIEHPEFFDHVQQGKPVTNKFVDHHPDKSISYSGLEALDSNFIFNDPNDE